MKAELTVEYGRTNVWLAVEIDTPEPVAKPRHRRAPALVAAVAVTVLGFVVGVNVVDAPAAAGPAAAHAY
jgi:hypothetical protein